MAIFGFCAEAKNKTKNKTKLIPDTFQLFRRPMLKVIPSTDMQDIGRSRRAYSFVFIKLAMVQ